MKRILVFSLTFIVAALFLSWSFPPGMVIAAGSQPELSRDTKGVIRLVFGRADSIFCATSRDGGTSFSPPQFVGHIKEMHLGMSRGPQLASSARYSVITAMDKTGNIHYFELDNTGGNWKYKGTVNDIPASAPEGLMGLAADDHDHFYAVWLDLRHNRKNNICFSTLQTPQGKWAKNKLIYTSPDGHTCECCKPNIAVEGQKVAVMFRNWLNGSRDLYVLTSDNSGTTFEPAQKLGTGTWKLNGCPMDGGGVAIDAQGEVHTVWQREGTIYYCQPGNEEVALAKGRSCSLAVDPVNRQDLLVTLQEAGQVKLLNLSDKKETAVGEGSFLKPMVLGNHHALLVWEQDKHIQSRKM